jgi:hypothetical protein
MAIRLRSILLLIAVVAFLLAAFSLFPRVQWIPFGYAAVAAAFVVP